jgi:hypothetical protein
MDKFDSIAVFNPDDGQVSWFSRTENPKTASQPIKGHIARLQGRTMILYREHGILHFRVDDKDFQLTGEIEIKLVSVDHKTNCFMIFCKGAQLFRWTYQRPIIDPPLEVDPTLGVEEEHFDFCLFVHNVVHDPLRRARIYTKEYS